MFKIYEERENKKTRKSFVPFFAGHLHHSSSSYTVLPDGCFLLDASGRHLLLPINRESLQHQQ